MWTLVIWVFVLFPGDMRVLTGIPGFANKGACESAGPPIAKAILDPIASDARGYTMDPKARVSFICVSNGK